MGVGARGREAERAGLHRLGGQGSHAGNLRLGRALHMVAAAIAHDIGAQRGVGHVRAEIDGIFTLAQGIEIIGKTLPIPPQPLRQRGAGDVLHALQKLDQPVVLVGAGGGESYAAISHRGGGDAVDRGGGEDLIPGDLAVVMGVDVDKAGGYDAAVGVDGFACRSRYLADGHDLVALDGEVAAVAGGPGAVDEGAVLHQEIEHVASP